MQPAAAPTPTDLLHQSWADGSRCHSNNLWRDSRLGAEKEAVSDDDPSAGDAVLEGDETVVDCVINHDNL